MINHLQNVLVTISDKKLAVDVAPQDGIIDYYTADVITANDYAPFGMAMPGRKYSNGSSSYRYGFNGKENDKETYGEGNAYDFEARIYDPRLGRFLSVDPMYRSFPHQSPFVFADNNPVALIDFKGMSGEPPTQLNVKTSFLKYVKAWDLQISVIRLAASALYVGYEAKASKALKEYETFMDKIENKYRIGSSIAGVGGGGANGKWGEPDKKSSDDDYYRPSIGEQIKQLHMSKTEKAKADKLLGKANGYKKTAQDMEMVAQILGKLSSTGVALEIVPKMYKELKNMYDQSKEKKEFNVDKEVGKMVNNYLKKQAQKVKDAASKSEN